MRITHIFETHVQADHISGARRLSEATGAPVIFHKSAPVAFPHVDVGDGERHDLGNVSLSILHTPGHTPDSVSILVTDKTRAPEPWFVLTGDTLFSGGVGRPGPHRRRLRNGVRRGAPRESPRQTLEAARSCRGLPRALRGRGVRQGAER